METNIITMKNYALQYKNYWHANMTMCIHNSVIYDYTSFVVMLHSLQTYKKLVCLNPFIMETQKIAIVRTPIINHTLKVRWPLCFTSSFAPLVTSRYRWITVIETSLHWIHFTVRSRFALLQIDTLCCQQKQLEQRRTKVALSIVELCLAEGIKNSVKYNFFWNFIVTCWSVGLIWRHFWAWLRLTNAAKQKCEAGFWVILLGRKPQTTMIPNIQLLPYCKIKITNQKA